MRRLLGKTSASGELRLPAVPAPVKLGRRRFGGDQDHESTSAAPTATTSPPYRRRRVSLVVLTVGPCCAPRGAVTDSLTCGRGSKANSTATAVATGATQTGCTPTACDAGRTTSPAYATCGTCTTVATNTTIAAIAMRPAVSASAAMATR